MRDCRFRGGIAGETPRIFFWFTGSGVKDCRFRRMDNRYRLDTVPVIILFDEHFSRRVQTKIMEDGSAYIKCVNKGCPNTLRHLFRYRKVDLAPLK